jgi:hypothetical protein
VLLWPREILGHLKIGILVLDGSGSVVGTVEEFGARLGSNRLKAVGVVLAIRLDRLTKINR